MDLILAAAAALLAGGAIGFLLARARTLRTLAERDHLAQERARVERELLAIRSELQSERDQRVASAARESELQRTLAAQRQFVEEAKQQLEGSYAKLSEGALSGAIEKLLHVVRPHLDGNRGEIVSTLDTKKVEIEALLTPVREMIERYQQELRSSEAQRNRGYAAVQEQVKALLEATQKTEKEASRLYGALKVPTVRGAWGESTLRNCVELAGMNEFCDFDVQMTVATEEGRRLRPDMIVRLPDSRVIAVDAKAPINAYLEAAEATDERRRRELLDLHAATLRRHIDQLSRKEYQENVQSQLGKTLNFTILFIGGEHFLSAAMTTDPTIFEYAAGRNVVLASPTILVPLLKALASGWKAEKLEENAQRSLTLAQNVYDQLVRIFENIAAVGKALDTTVSRYNTAIGALDNIVPKARQLGEHVASTRGISLSIPIEEPVRESVKLQAQSLLPMDDGSRPPQEPEPKREATEAEVVTQPLLWQK